MDFYNLKDLLLQKKREIHAGSRPIKTKKQPSY